MRALRGAATRRTSSAAKGPRRRPAPASALASGRGVTAGPCFPSARVGGRPRAAAARSAAPCDGHQSCAGGRAVGGLPARREWAWRRAPAEGPAAGRAAGSRAWCAARGPERAPGVARSARSKVLRPKHGLSRVTTGLEPHPRVSGLRTLLRALNSPTLSTRVCRARRACTPDVAPGNKGQEPLERFVLRHAVQAPLERVVLRHAALARGFQVSCVWCSDAARGEAYPSLRGSHWRSSAVFGHVFVRILLAVKQRSQGTASPVRCMGTQQSRLSCSLFCPTWVLTSELPPGRRPLRFWSQCSSCQSAWHEAPIFGARASTTKYSSRVLVQSCWLVLCLGLRNGCGLPPSSCLPTPQDVAQHELGHAAVGGHACV